MTTETVPDDASEIDGAHDSMAADKFTASFIFVTPELAKRWLAKNDKNRKPNKGTIQRYLLDMDAGNWAFTGEPIKFADTGELLDGQHRLTAIAQHGEPVLMLVVRGLTSEAQDVMDTGRKRSAADMFDIAEKDNAVLLASTSRLVLGYMGGNITTSISSTIGQPSNSMIRDLVESDPMVSWATQVASRLRGNIPANPAAISFAAWLMGRVDTAATVQYLNSIAEMRTEGIGDPRFTLLKRLNVAKTQRERLTSVEQAFYIVRAWNAWRTGATLKALKASTSAGPTPFPEPV